MTASLGIASVDVIWETDVIVARADSAMYEAKAQRTKSRCRFADAHRFGCVKRPSPMIRFSRESSRARKSDRTMRAGAHRLGLRRFQ